MAPLKPSLVVVKINRFSIQKQDIHISLLPKKLAATSLFSTPYFLLAAKKGTPTREGMSSLFTFSISKPVFSSSFGTFSLKRLATSQKSITFAAAKLKQRTRRDARVAEEARLESVYTSKAYPGFESRSLRETGVPIKSEALRTADTGKSCTASSLRIPQGLTAARVVGCSGAMQIAFPPASLAQLARARDL